MPRKARTPPPPPSPSALMRVPPAAHLPPAQAAAQAGASYVWHASYGKGWEAGWAAGWAAGAGGPLAPEAGADRTDEEARHRDERAAACYRVELDGLWAGLFARGERERKRRRNEMEGGEEGGGGREGKRGRRGGVELELGGREEGRRRERGVRLYGERGWEAVRKVEEEMEVRFRRRVGELGARLWPVVSVRRVEGMGGGRRGGGAGSGG